MEKLLYAAIFLFVTALLYWAALPKKWRCPFLFGLSILFAGVFSIKYTAYFLFNIAIGYYAGRAVRSKDQRALKILRWMLFWLVGNLCFFKYFNQLLDALTAVAVRLGLPQIDLPRVALPLGISYVIFRLIHYVVESYRNKVPEGTFSELGMYVLFFPTFLAGPVDRFQNIQPQVDKQDKLDLSNINQGLIRLLIGIVRKFVVADTLAKYVMPVLYTPGDYSRWIVILAMYGLSIRVYMDFAGYTDMAIGVGRLFGYKLMENFNKPFLQKNIAMFWRNWHISVYSWIRDYFFFPLFGYRASNLKVYVGIFTSMMVFMLWHKLSWNWFALGCYHGGGLIVWNLFQEAKRKYPKLRKAVMRKSLDPLSMAFTFTFVSFGFLIFNLEVGQVANIMRAIF